MNGFLDKLENQSIKSEEQEKQSRNELIQQLSNFSTNMSSTINENVTAAKESTVRNEQLAIELKELTEKLSHLMGGLDNYSGRMIEVSENMEQASSKVRSASLVLEKEIGKAIDAVTNLSIENGAMLENTQNIFDKVGGLNDELRATAENITEASKIVDKTFSELNKHQQQFLSKQEITLHRYEESMQKEFAILTQNANDFLKNYSEMVEEQTNLRLGAWNKQTEEFSRQMLNAVRSLQSVIADIEEKISS